MHKACNQLFSSHFVCLLHVQCTFLYPSVTDRCCLVYWEGEDSVTVLTSVKVTMETEDVGVSCSVREGSVTHTNGRLAAFGMCEG